MWLLRSVAVESFRLLKDGGSFCVFTDWRMYPHLAPALESSGFRLQNMIVWNKSQMGLGRGFRPQHEIIIHLVKGKPKFYDNKTGNVITEKRVSPTRRLHQTEKPVQLLAKLIRVITPPGGVVLDPFAGSGSTLVAAKREGFSFVGIERDPEYVEIAHIRVGEAPKGGAEDAI
ncbi:DNA methylase [Melghirimyces algeriensis]|uniref:Methyltransferase n=1 Tax=Melghirimyces algeriensis TaxID=910412 RepID=A0A521F783_9BACL|nr:DNA methylase [Melghirimyces algeriensis]